MDANRAGLVERMFLNPVLVKLQTGSPPMLSSMEVAAITPLYLDKYKHNGLLLDVLKVKPGGQKALEIALDETNQGYLAELLRAPEEITQATASNENPAQVQRETILQVMSANNNNDDDDIDLK